MNEATKTLTTLPAIRPVAPVTKTHKVLIGLGHTVGREVRPDGTLGVYEVRANPARTNEWGLVPEEDWAAAEAAENEPEEGPRHPTWPHLPAGPWTYKGMTENRFSPAPGVPSKPGGSCDYCGIGIAYEFNFQAPSGERFKVGSICVEKMMKTMGRVDAPALNAAAKVIREAKNAAARRRRKVKKEEKAAAAAVVKAEVRGRLDAVMASKLAAASSIPHPLEWRAAKGDSLADWAEWMRDNGGPRAWEGVITRLEQV